MKVLLMGTHWDCLTMPEGKEHFPHQHQWRVSAERSELDPKGRPYCTVCGGKPCFYELDEVEADSFKCINSVKCGLSRIVERDK